MRKPGGTGTTWLGVTMQDTPTLPELPRYLFADETRILDFSVNLGFLNLGNRFKKI